jgi:hypothetical protein
MFLHGEAAAVSGSPADSATKDEAFALTALDISSGSFPWEDDSKSLEFRVSYF